MSAYVATGRIRRVTPHWAMDAIERRDVETRPESHDADGAGARLTPIVDADPLIERLTAIRDRWSQLTFYLFDIEGWR